jgi:hypothetical protein
MERATTQTEKVTRTMFVDVLVRDKRAKGISEEKLILDKFIEVTGLPNRCTEDVVPLVGTASSVTTKEKMISKFSNRESVLLS